MASGDRIRLILDDTPLKRERKKFEVLTQRNEAAARGRARGKHQARSSRSGGKQGFTGGVVDFLQRDEFTGRLGTGARAAFSFASGKGHMGGGAALVGITLALVSLEEAVNRIKAVQEGQQSIQQSVAEQLDILVPDLITKHFRSLFQAEFRRVQSALREEVRAQIQTLSQSEFLKQSQAFRDAVASQMATLLEAENAREQGYGFVGGGG